MGKKYTQGLHQDKNDILNVSIGQTRDGQEEWITPVALWERDKSSGLYLPPGVSDDVHPVKVQPQGYIVPVLNDASFTVAAGETREILSKRSPQMPWLIGSIRLAAGCGLRYRVHHGAVYYSSTLQDVTELTSQHEFCFQMVGLSYMVLLNNPTAAAITCRVSAMETLTKELSFR